MNATVNFIASLIVAILAYLTGWWHGRQSLKEEIAEATKDLAQSADALNESVESNKPQPKNKE